MKQNNCECAILADLNDNPVPLTGIDVKCVIGDILSKVAITQIYENREDRNIEAVYTFPLPYKAALLDFTVTVGNEVRHGTVMKKKQARETYEDAVEQGNSAAMLEKTDEGMYSMSVGNILAGQKIEISFSYSQFNIWNGSLLRFYLPTVIAPKYGDPARAGIDELHAPVTSVFAENTVNCKISITENLRKYEVSSPTHQLERSETGDSLDLFVKTFADRDFILEIRSGSERVPYSCIGRDGDGYVAAVAMTPDFGKEIRSVPRDIDIVVDCSGSMSGESIEQARTAIERILEKLTEDCRFNIIRFGSSVKKLFRVPAKVSAQSMEKAGKVLLEMDADMGGTNLEGALDVSYNYHSKDRLHDILLITDGEVYEDNAFYEAAEKSGCRIFSVGVGNAVSEGLLRKLSAITSGMAEFVTPNENMAERIVRHFQRMSMPVMNSEIIWPVEADWVWPEKNQMLYHGDTGVFFARFSEKPAGCVELKAHSGDESVYSWKTVLTTSSDETPCSDLARMAILERISERNDDESADLAVSYRLITDLTNYILVRENHDSDNIALPELRTVPQMVPQGFSGALCCAETVEYSRNSGTGFFGSAFSKMLGIDSRKQVRKGVVCQCDSAPAAETANNPFSLILAALDQRAVKHLFADKCIDALEKLGLKSSAADILRLIVKNGTDERVVFILFLNRLMQRNADAFDSTSVREYIVRSYGRLSASEKKLEDSVQDEFEQIFQLN